jgi:alkylhydroperoxidase family enzyme
MKPLPLQDWDSSLQHVIDDMHGRPINVHALMANHPALLNAWWNLREYLVRGGDLEQRHCEIVILRVATHMRSWYEWASHVVRGLDSGLTMDEIECLRTDAGEWSPMDAALITAVDELARENTIGKRTCERLADHFTSRQVMDVIVLHGMYLTLGCMINTWGVELDEAVRERLPAQTTESDFLGNP